jgi:hypothetical protein
VERHALERHAVAVAGAVNALLLCADKCGRQPPRATDGGPPFVYCMTCTKSRLRQHAVAVAQRLLPEGHWEGHLWRCGDISGQAGDSLSVDLGGGRNHGRWRDWASASDGGDLLDLIEASPHGGCDDKVRAMRWAHDFLNAPTPPASGTVPRPRSRTSADSQVRAGRRWRQAKPLVRGDIAWRYFARRGIDLARLPALPMLRIHSDLWNEEAKCRFPALLAAVAGPGGRFTAIHRTWLTVRADGVVEKAPVEEAKKALGACFGGCIPLTHGASGRSWREIWGASEPAGLVAIGEGIEDALSIAQDAPAWRCVAGVSLSIMFGMELPAAITEVMLIEQHDRPGSKAARDLPRVEAHFQQLGKTVRRIFPRDRAVKDVNDLARRRYAHLEPRR